MAGASYGILTIGSLVIIENKNHQRTLSIPRELSSAGTVWNGATNMSPYIELLKLFCIG